MCAFLCCQLVPGIAEGPSRWNKSIIILAQNPGQMKEWKVRQNEHPAGNVHQSTAALLPLSQGILFPAQSHSLLASCNSCKLFFRSSRKLSKVTVTHKDRTPLKIAFYYLWEEGGGGTAAFEGNIWAQPQQLDFTEIHLQLLPIACAWSDFESNRGFFMWSAISRGWNLRCNWAKGHYLKATAKKRHLLWSQLRPLS